MDGRKVQVQINTTKTDKFFYNPIWDEPVITVNEVDYSDSTETGEVAEQGPVEEKGEEEGS